MAAGKMGIHRLTRKTPSTKPPSSDSPPESNPPNASNTSFTNQFSHLASSITASTDLQDIGGLLPTPFTPAHDDHHYLTQPSSPLLRMPPEIRYEIYRYLIPTPAKRFWPIAFALTASKNTSKRSSGNRHRGSPSNPSDSHSGSGSSSRGDGRGNGSGSGGSRKRNDPLAILLTSKLIYHEALSVLYSEHLFHFIGPNYLPVLEFIRKLGPDARSQIRQIRLTLLAQEKGDVHGAERGHEAFCEVIHEACPGLTTLKADPVVWL